ncbi:Latisemin [Dactylellina cionopaga]|nr:Latisemin [Dactylellina cionopaga]
MKFTLVLSTLLGATSVLASPIERDVEGHEIDDSFDQTPTNDTMLVGIPMSFEAHKEEKRSSPSSPGNYAPSRPGTFNPPSNTGDFLPESQYRDAILAVHNAARTAHGCPAFTWSTELVNYAQSNTPVCVFQHSPNLNRDGVGENILAGFKPLDQMVREMWYENELSKYDFGRQGFTHGTGHLTQMVWRASTEVGCAVRQCNFGTYLKCDYRQAGNVIGQFEANVNAPRSKIAQTPPSNNYNQNQPSNDYNNQSPPSNYYNQRPKNANNQRPNNSGNQSPPTTYRNQNTGSNRGQNSGSIRTIGYSCRTANGVTRCRKTTGAQSNRSQYQQYN